MSTKEFVVTRNQSGATLASIVRQHCSYSWSQARQCIAAGNVRLGQMICRDAARRLKAGQRIRVQMQAPTATLPSRPSAQESASTLILYVDEELIVADKPAGMTTMRHKHEVAEFGQRAQRFLPPTLADLLPRLIAPRAARPARIRAVHRLDRDTSGLVVFARTAAAESRLGLQFRAHTIGRRYLAIVRGQAKSERIESYFVADRGDGRRGSAAGSTDGKRAVTNVVVLDQLGEYTLVECRLETGRTHQVRIHLGERGTPLCGERVYDRPLHGKPLPDASGAPRIALHATELALDHPATGKRLKLNSPLPKDMQALLERLRRQKNG